MKTWILVANSARARLFEAGKSDGALHELADFADASARQPGSASTQDRRPRVQESHGQARHAIEPHTSPEEKAAQEFAHALADMLNHGRVEHDFQRLVLVAAPRFLGHLREALNEEVGKLVVRSVDQDQTRASPEDIQALLHAG